MLIIPYFSTRIFLDLSHTAIKLSHQANASRRDQLLDEQDATSQISTLQPTSATLQVKSLKRSSNFARDLQKRLATIDKYLRGLASTDKQDPVKDGQRSTFNAHKSTVNISLIGASLMKRNLLRFRKNYRAAI
ncbi:hypothetical protein MBM_00062 [Drepanopeziza brunnea f. sp. 'multigermtubi' MB_m1]|uniref:Uncharacterized protein n=1 Tax=Marssonina brunnea f. sp. multigermtubi (strain MB_m1) TaxID=1072389 RepID=K1Y6X3_MARBU|nr:uncharacterized protein MBM_00062 [Drepanopeziza brunnea f. sp. 'multigermtubi' MB_m1]EKD20949.1 hypothetical protein MBM_00062 [Drepanopeziza brunnea f. sp. 'multigermtubi' MB_m1]